MARGWRCGEQEERKDAAGAAPLPARRSALVAGPAPGMSNPCILDVCRLCQCRCCSCSCHSEASASAAGHEAANGNSRC